MQYFNLDNRSMPAIGYGTFQGDDGNAKVKTAVAMALERGYRLIDTAAAYGNEEEVGEAIRESGLPRNQLFITTKLYDVFEILKA